MRRRRTRGIWLRIEPLSLGGPRFTAGHTLCVRFVLSVADLSGPCSLVDGFLRALTPLRCLFTDSMASTAHPDSQRLRSGFLSAYLAGDGKLTGYISPSSDIVSVQPPPFSQGSFLTASLGRRSCSTVDWVVPARFPAWCPGRSWLRVKDGGIEKDSLGEVRPSCLSAHLILVWKRWLGNNHMPSCF